MVNTWHETVQKTIVVLTVCCLCVMRLLSHCMPISLAPSSSWLPLHLQRAACRPDNVSNSWARGLTTRPASRAFTQWSYHWVLARAVGQMWCEKLLGLLTKPLPPLSPTSWVRRLYTSWSWCQLERYVRCLAPWMNDGRQTAAAEWSWSATGIPKFLFKLVMHFGVCE